MNKDILLRDNLVEECFRLFSLWKERLEQSFHNVRISVTRHYVEARECSDALITVLCSAMILDATLDQPDVIDLQIEFTDHNTPIYVTADLVWGDGNGCIELTLSEEPVVLNEGSVEVIKSSLMDFYDAIASSLQRRSPSYATPIKVIMNKMPSK